MEAIFLVCGAGGPQLKRNPLGGGNLVYGGEMQRIAWCLAPAWALIASAYLLFGPTVVTVGSSITLRPEGVTRSEMPPTSTSLFATQGASTLIPLLVPVVLAALPLLSRNQMGQLVLGVFAVLSLGTFCFLGMMSVGRYYVPSVVLLLVAPVLSLLFDKSSSDAAA